MADHWLEQALGGRPSHGPAVSPLALSGPVVGPIEAMSREITIPGGGGDPRVFDLRTLDQWASWTLDYFCTGAPVEIVVHQFFQHGEKLTRTTVGPGSGDRVVFAGSAIVEVLALTGVDAVFRGTVLVNGGGVPIMPPWDQTLELSAGGPPVGPGVWVPFPFVGTLVDGGFCPTDRHQLTVYNNKPAQPADYRFVDSGGFGVAQGSLGAVTSLYHLGQFQLQVRNAGATGAKINLTGIWRRADR